VEAAVFGTERMVTWCPFRKIPGFRLLLLLVEVMVCTPWGFAETPWRFAEKEALGQNVS
jgi:hypothetical protein